MRRVRDLWAPTVVLNGLVGREGHGLAGSQQVTGGDHMVWDKLRRFLPCKGDAVKGDGELPDVSWIAAADNPWGVRVLDVRPVTLTLLALSTDRQCAQNAVSFGQDDGTSLDGPDGFDKTAQPS